MTEKMAKVVDGTKHQLWKWLGSMFMENKKGADGKDYMAASLTRVLTLILFIACLIYWYIRPDEVPDSMVYTLWGLLGVRTSYKISDAIAAPKEVISTEEIISTGAP